MQQQIQRNRTVTTYEALTPFPEKKKNTRVLFIVTYHPGLPNIGSMLRNIHPLLHISDRCKEALKDVPLMAFCRPKSLKGAHL